MKSHFTILLLLAALTVKADALYTNIVFHVASGYPITGNVILHLEHSKNMFEAQAVFDLGNASPSNLGEKLISFPSDDVSIWMLVKNCGSLKLRSRSPALGKSPVGTINAGSGNAYVTFMFESHSQVQPLAVVFKFRNDYTVFPLASR